MIGVNSGGYVEMSEFESLAALERFMNRIFHGQEELIAKIVSDFTTCVMPGTFSVSVWNSVM